MILTFICAHGLYLPAMKSFCYPLLTLLFKSRVHVQSFYSCPAGNHTSGSRSTSLSRRQFKMGLSKTISVLVLRILSGVSLPWSSFSPDPLTYLETQLLRGGLGLSQGMALNPTFLQHHTPSIILDVWHLSRGISMCCCLHSGCAFSMTKLPSLECARVRALVHPDFHS